MSPAKPKAPSPPISLRPSPAIRAELEARAGEERGEGVPTVAADMLGRYLEMVRRDVPLLSDQQWDVLRDALNGMLFRDNPQSIAWIDAQVADAIARRDVAKKHDVDGEALLAAIRSWTYGQRVAVADAVERWWREHG